MKILRHIGKIQLEFKAFPAAAQTPHQTKVGEENKIRSHLQKQNHDDKKNITAKIRVILSSGRL